MLCEIIVCFSQMLEITMSSGQSAITKIESNGWEQHKTQLLIGPFAEESRVKKMQLKLLKIYFNLTIYASLIKLYLLYRIIQRSHPTI